jgi:hypothetical protein
MPYVALTNINDFVVVGVGTTKDAAYNDAHRNSSSTVTVYKCTQGVYAKIRKCRIICDTSIKYEAGRFTLR